MKSSLKIHSKFALLHIISLGTKCGYVQTGYGTGYHGARCVGGSGWLWYWVAGREVCWWLRLVMVLGSRAGVLVAQAGYGTG
jgi:hypothetical protein